MKKKDYLLIFFHVMSKKNQSGINLHIFISMINCFFFLRIPVNDTGYLYPNTSELILGDRTLISLIIDEWNSRNLLPIALRIVNNIPNFVRHIKHILFVEGGEDRPKTSIERPQRISVVRRKFGISEIYFSFFFFRCLYPRKNITHCTRESGHFDVWCND